MKNTRSSTILIICFVLLSLACSGCRRKPPASLDEKVDTVIFLSRNLNTCELVPYQIAHPEWIKRLQCSIKDDLKHLDKYNDCGLPLAVRHVLVFCNEQGKNTAFRILGNEFIVYAKSRYYATKTMETLKDAKAQKIAVKISKEKARKIAPELSDYLW